MERKSSIDMERVIGHLNDCMEASRRDNTWVFVRKDIVEDVLVLLKEHEEIVRCKDCKHKEESVSPSWEAWCNRLHCGCDNDWFCADGEVGK